MLRHYSSSRTAVLSVTIPICLGILGFVLSPTVPNKVGWYLLAAEALLFLYAICLSMFFSVKYEQSRLYLIRIEGGEEVDYYTAVTGVRKRGGVHIDAIDWSILLIGAALHAAFYIYYFT